MTLYTNIILYLLVFLRVFYSENFKKSQNLLSLILNMYKKAWRLKLKNELIYQKIVRFSRHLSKFEWKLISQFFEIWTAIIVFKNKVSKYIQSKCKFTKIGLLILIFDHISEMSVKNCLNLSHFDSISIVRNTTKIVKLLILSICTTKKIAME